MSDIVLRKFEVERNWRDGGKTYECKARFSMKGMDFTIELPAELGDALVAVCRGKIAEASATAIEHLHILSKENTE